MTRWIKDVDIIQLALNCQDTGSVALIVLLFNTGTLEHGMQLTVQHTQ